MVLAQNAFSLLHHYKQKSFSHTKSKDEIKNSKSLKIPFPEGKERKHLFSVDPCTYLADIWPGGGTPYNVREGSARKEYLFLASAIRKGRDFTH